MGFWRRQLKMMEDERALTASTPRRDGSSCDFFGGGGEFIVTRSAFSVCTIMMEGILFPVTLVTRLAVVPVGVTGVCGRAGRRGHGGNRGCVQGLVSRDSLHNHGLDLLRNDGTRRSIGDMGRASRCDVISALAAPAEANETGQESCSQDTQDNTSNCASRDTTRLGGDGERSFSGGQDGLSGGGASSSARPSTTAGGSGGTADDTGSARDPGGSSRQDSGAIDNGSCIHDTSCTGNNTSLATVVGSAVVVAGSGIASGSGSGWSGCAADDTRSTRHPSSCSRKNGRASDNGSSADDASGSRNNAGLTSIVGCSVINTRRGSSIVRGFGVKGTSGSTITWTSRGADRESGGSLTRTILSRASKGVGKITSAAINKTLDINRMLESESMTMT